MRHSFFEKILVLALCLFTCMNITANDQLADDLTDMSLEDLMNIEITSVSKKPQKQTEAAAAIFVITGDDLHRWGVTNIPDALRRVPGLNVARIDANKWAITSRGFNSRFANKLLVLIDGRSVYTPLFAGVYWDANQVMLDDVERIEVIRGPGGTLWGANAVNGVINIITKSASDTQGTLISAGVGDEEDGFVNLRHGGTINGDTPFRVYGQFRSVDTGYSAGTPRDDSDFGQIGFRADWHRNNNDTHTMQGDFYDGTSSQELSTPDPADPFMLPPITFTDDAEVEGGNLLYRWKHQIDETSDFALQVYFDHVSRESAALFEDRQTFDIDFQHHIAWNEQHDVVWGLNYRFITDDYEDLTIFSLAPSSRDVDLYSAFIQDEISLLDNRAKLTLGSKFEHNDFTGFEFQPNVRLAYTTDSGNTVWGAVSRAVRTPARGEHDVSLLILTPFGTVDVNGDSDYDSETLVAYEAGYRFSPIDNVAVDLTAFYNVYDELRTIDGFSATFPDVFFENNMEGNTWGIEVDSRWQITPHTRLNANYTYLKMDLTLINSSDDPFSESAEDASPSHQANIWLTTDLSDSLTLDTGIRYVGSLTTSPLVAKTDSYTAVDARLGWTPRPGLELSIVGQNLFDSHHPEFNPDFIFSSPTETERSIFATINWQL